MAKLDPETKVGDHLDGVEFLFEKALKYANELPPTQHFMEIGCWRGGTACLLMQAIRQSKHPERLLITVDPYGGKPFKLGPVDILTADTTNYTEKIYREAILRMSEYAQKHNLNHTHYKMTSEDFMDIFDKVTLWQNGEQLDHEFGFVYVDGDHNFRTVTKEVEWLRERMPGGMIVMDDIPYIERGLPADDGHKLIVDLHRSADFEDNFRIYWRVA